MLQVNGATGLQANLVAGNTTVTLANSGNINMSIAGTANVLKVANTGTYTTGLISATGNIYGNNLSLAGNIYGNVNANINGTISTTGNVYIAGNLSVAGTVNTVPGTYGSFANVANITAAADNTAYAVLLGNTLVSSGISLGTGGSNSRVIISKAGTYRVQYDVGFSITGGNPTGYFWLRKNGTDITNSQTSIAGTNNQTLQLNGDFIITAVANDYVELYWAISSHTNATLVYTAAQTVPFAMPASPSVIVTVTPAGV